MSDDPLIDARGLCARHGPREVVHDVDLAVRRGEVVALLGPNGAGKSTLLGALAGATAPSSGEVIHRGRVAIALQSPDLARRSVLANVTAGLAWWGVARAQRRDRAMTALQALGVAGLAGRPATSLSGGERRRVHLARALAVAPDALLLDEPFAGLDAEVRATLLADVVSVLRDPARATLVVVHDRAEAWALADRLAILIGGRLVADGPPARLLATPPSPEVARLLGYDGELRGPHGERRLVRAAQVTLDPDGPHAARVARAIPTEDGARVELELDDGRVYATVAGGWGPIPRPGDRVRIRIDGGVRFDA